MPRYHRLQFSVDRNITNQRLRKWGIRCILGYTWFQKLSFRNVIQGVQERFFGFQMHFSPWIRHPRDPGPRPKLVWEVAVLFKPIKFFWNLWPRGQKIEKMAGAVCMASRDAFEVVAVNSSIWYGLSTKSIEILHLLNLTFDGKPLYKK